MMLVEKEKQREMKIINFNVCVNDLESVDVLHVSHGYSSVC